MQDFPINPYALILGISASIIFLTTYFTLLHKKVSFKKIWVFIFLSSISTLFFGKVFGSLGLWISTETWYWGPSSVLGLHVTEVFFWRPWAQNNGPSGQILLKRWSFCNPLALATGRIACLTAGCCFIRNGIPLNWPLVEASFLVVLGLYLYKNSHKSPQRLFQTYLFSSLSLRFFLDFLRGDAIRGVWSEKWMFLSFPQLICLGLLLILALDSQRRKYHN